MSTILHALDQSPEVGWKPVAGSVMPVSGWSDLAMINKLAPGVVISFNYPAANYCGVRPRLERRRVLIRQLRDLAEEPLEPRTAVREPQLRRGRWLVTGFDLERSAERSFYVESMTDLICHPLCGGFCVAEVEPPGEVKICRIVASMLSYAAADAQAACCAMEEGENEYVVLPQALGEVGIGR